MNSVIVILLVMLLLVILVVLIIIAAIRHDKKVKKMVADYKKTAEQTFNNLKDFKPEKYRIAHYTGMSIGFDNQQKKICILDALNKPFIYGYDKILQCEVIVDGDSVLKQSTTSTIGRTVLGGLVGGGVGAIVGGATGKKIQKKIIKSIDLKLVINDTVNPIFIVNFLSAPKGTAYYSIALSEAEWWHGLFAGLIKQGNEEVIKFSEKTSIANEIQKLKDLLDNGVISLEDFNKQKSRLLE